MAGEDLGVYEKLGERIRDIRVKKGMSQADLANAAHIALPHVSRIERGKVKMQLDTFIRIAEALEISTDELLRLNVPVVNSLYKSEFADLLDDCTPSEIDSILKIVKELKTTMHQKQKSFEDYRPQS